MSHNRLSAKLPQAVHHADNNTQTRHACNEYKNPACRYPKRVPTMARRKSRTRNGMLDLHKKKCYATRKRYIILFRCGGRSPLLRVDRLDKQGNRRQTSATFFSPRKKQFMVGTEQGKVPPQVCTALPYIQFEVSRVTKQLIHARRLLQKHCYLFFSS